MDFKKWKASHDDSLLKLERIPEVLRIGEVSSLHEDDPEDWHVQNLLCGKNVLIDMSIHTAYVNAIRAAQYFIYIEYQYFLGSSYNWNNYKDLGANNLIPMEIALKMQIKSVQMRDFQHILFCQCGQKVFLPVLPLRGFYFGSIIQCK